MLTDSSGIFLSLPNCCSFFTTGYTESGLVMSKTRCGDPATCTAWTSPSHPVTATQPQSIAHVPNSIPRIHTVTRSECVISPSQVFIFMLAPVKFKDKSHVWQYQQYSTCLACTRVRIPPSTSSKLTHALILNFRLGTLSSLSEASNFSYTRFRILFKNKFP